MGKMHIITIRLLATLVFSITITGLYGQPETLKNPLRKQADTISFLHISDAHIIQHADLYHPVIAKARNHYANGTKHLSDFLTEMPVETGSEMVVHTGDMIDFYEAENIEGNMDASQIEQFLQLLADRSVSFYMTLGNHDIASYHTEEDKLLIQVSQVKIQ
jgi:predicted MPP superfamily phosphohydrolase